MADLQKYKVLQGFIYSARVRACRGDVLELDPEELTVCQALVLRRLAPTDAELEGGLQDMGQPRLSPAMGGPKPKAGREPEPETDEEVQVHALLALNVDALEVAVLEFPAELLPLAGQLEGSGKSRKGALEAIALQLEERG